ncbi:MAG: DUF1501 domain-containing protein [Deltaproteobacteria bacterium]|nr:MAG: DUF1501 domain-containing protein [Deltaproteobacteria bacterium]
MRVHPPHLSRRGLLTLVAGGLCMPGWLLSGRRARAGTSGEGRLLFVFCTGGWDPTECIAPMLGTVVENNPGLVEASAHGIPFVTTEERPAVREFFESCGDRLAIVHGVEARSVAHDVCLRLMLTGSTLPGGNDWPSTVAASSSQDLLLPMVHISGPSYAADHSGSVVRVGASGQLSRLLDGSGMTDGDLAVDLPSAEAASRVDALVSGRLQAAAAGGGRGRAGQLLDLAAAADGRIADLIELGGELDLSGGQDFVGQAAIAAELMERGLCRTAMVEFEGWQGLSWDTHSDLPLQGHHFNTLMEGLSSIMADLDARRGSRGGPLSDEVTVVVLSEMGRYPRINSRGGKDHWTFTSAMFLGAGVAGGTVVGGYDPEAFTGFRVDLTTGALDDGGVALVPSHLGATIYALAGEDPAAALPDHPPIAAVIDG